MITIHARFVVSSDQLYLDINVNIVHTISHTYLFDSKVEDISIERNVETPQADLI